MEVQATVDVMEVIDKGDGSTYNRERTKKIFTVTLAGTSTKEIEVALGKLSQAAANQGWRIE